MKDSTRAVLLFGALVFSLGSLEKATAQRKSCFVPNMSTKLPESQLPIEFVSNLFSVEHYSQGILSLRNLGDTDIKEVSLVMDYMSPGGHLLVSIPFHSVRDGSTKSHGSELPPHYPEIPQHFSQTPRPGISFGLHGRSPSIVCGCPTQARLAFLRVSFEDTEFFWAIPDWRVDPDLLPLRTFLHLNASSQAMQVASMLVRIDQVGEVRDLSMMGSGFPESANEELVRQVRSWRFWPARKGGEPIGTEVRLILLVLQAGSSEPFNSQQSPCDDCSSSFVLVELIPREKKSGDWHVLYGGRLSTVNIPEDEKSSGTAGPTRPAY